MNARKPPGHGALNSWGQYAFKYIQFVRAPDSVVLGAGGMAVFILGTLLLTCGLGSIGRRSKAV
ncbi:MAG: hypothetical protein HY047_02015 [Acidobacteria bacterium]|nr:hypothetical protein [Acidobacteriota bacterium]